MKKKIVLAVGALAALIVLAGALMWPREELLPASSPAAFAPSAHNIERGAYLAQAGGCMACHTARGGPAYAGGRALETPFGTLVAPNITPDRASGIGLWNADDFWRALHNGKSRDGRLLYPAFPYTSYTKVTRADSDALFAFLRSLAPQRRANAAHALRWPYNQQFALAAWRLLYFKPAVFVPADSRSAEWNRGAYLVEGLGHCGACHSSRNSLGASAAGLSGGAAATLGWYAPSLVSDTEAGVRGWEVEHIVQLLGTGVGPRASVSGPMAEVVQRSLQHLTPQDLGAMATYLKALPGAAQAAQEPAAPQPPQRQLVRAKRLYETHCIECHGSDGKGLPPHYPALAGNRAVLMENALNPIRMVLNGGFAPSTAGNPRPYGMPAYSHLMDDAQVADVLTYLRSSWGNRAGAVSAAQVNRYRSVPLD